MTSSLQRVLFLLLALSAPAARGSDLARTLVTPTGELTQDGLDTRVLRQTQVQLRHELLTLGDLPLEAQLFADLRLTLELTRRVQRGPASFSWVGRVRGHDISRAVLLVEGDEVYGNLRFDGRLITLRPTAGGTHRAREIDTSSFAPCGTTEGDETHLPSPGDLLEPPTVHDDGSIIDVMVLYSDDIADRRANPELEIQLVIDETNSIYEDSGILTRLRLVAAREIDYDETGNSSTDLNHLRDGNDGFIDQVQLWRDDCGADAVSLWLDELDVCGLAGLMVNPGPGFQSRAYSVVQWACASNNFSFAHELGHNQGSHHDRDNAGGAAYPYSYGYKVPGEFRTVMSYACDDRCNRVGHFSNPDIDYIGQPTGVPLGRADEAHNAQSINETALVFSNFRQAADGCCEFDGFEGEDSCGLSAWAIDGTLQVRNFCDGSDDWFRFLGCNGETYVIELTSQEPDALLSIEVRAEGCTGTLAFDDGGGTGVSPRIEFSPGSSGQFDVRLTSLNGLGSGRAYEVRLSGYTPPIAAACCAPDAFEGQDSCADAVRIVGGSTRDGGFCLDEEDWLSFFACAGRDYAITPTWNEVGIALDLFSDDCSSLLASDDGGGTGMGSELRFTASTTGVHRVRVSSLGGTGLLTRYTILLDGDTSPCEPSAGGGPLPLLMSKSSSELSLSAENVDAETAYVLVEGSIRSWYALSTATCREDWAEGMSRVSLVLNAEDGDRWFVLGARGEGGTSPYGPDSNGDARQLSMDWPPSPCP